MCFFFGQGYPTQGKGTKSPVDQGLVCLAKEGEKCAGGHDHKPLFAIPFMCHDRQFAACVTFSLLNPVIWVARLDTLNLEVQTGQISTDHIW